MSTTATYTIGYTEPQYAYSDYPPAVPTTLSRASSTPSLCVRLSYASFPDLVEDIVGLAGYDTQTTVRATCSGLKSYVDRILCAPTLRFVAKSGGWRVTAQSPEASWVLPFFHPTSDLAPQKNAIKKATKVTLDNVPPSKRVDELLAHLDPGAEVAVEHGQNGPAPAHRLPALRQLSVGLTPNCACGAALATRTVFGRQMLAFLQRSGRVSGAGGLGGGEEGLVHAAARVRLRLTPLLVSGSGTSLICHALTRAVQPDTRHLALEFEGFPGLPWHPEHLLPDPPPCPDLALDIEVRVIHPEANLARRFADHLGIGEERICVRQKPRCECGRETCWECGQEMHEATAGMIM